MPPKTPPPVNLLPSSKNFTIQLIGERLTKSVSWYMPA